MYVYEFTKYYGLCLLVQLQHYIFISYIFDKTYIKFYLIYKIYLEL